MVLDVRGITSKERNIYIGIGLNTLASMQWQKSFSGSLVTQTRVKGSKMGSNYRVKVIESNNIHTPRLDDVGRPQLGKWKCLHFLFWLQRLWPSLRSSFITAINLRPNPGQPPRHGCERERSKVIKHLIHVYPAFNFDDITTINLEWDGGK